MMNTIICGDARTLTPTLTYDYVFTSPPDFDEVGSTVDLTAYQTFLSELFALFRPRLGLITVAFTDRKHRSTIVPKHLALYHAMTDLGYTLRSHKIWVKSDKINLFRLTYGNVMTFSTGVWRAARQSQDASFAPDVWNDGYGHYEQYTYGMPVMVPVRCIRNYTPPESIVYDPFMGSGTTAIAARDTGRCYLGTELDPTVHALAETRLALHAARFPDA